MGQILNNLSILITRPARQAAPLVSKINELGGRSSLFPTLEIISSDASQLKKILTPKTYWDKVIFTSANAVYPVMPFWPALTCQPLVFAIGSGTACALAEHNVVAKIPDAEFNSEGLLALADLQNVSRHRLAIFTGRGGRNLLAKQLRQRGAMVRLIPVYERRCPRVAIDDAYEQWQQAGINLIVSTSGESLLNLCSMAKTTKVRDWLYQSKLLVISPRMLQLAQNLGFKQAILLAANASDEAIVDALISYAKRATDPVQSIE